MSLSLIYLQQLTGLELDDLRGDALRHGRDDSRAGGLWVFISIGIHEQISNNISVCYTLNIHRVDPTCMICDIYTYHIYHIQSDLIYTPYP